MKRGRKPKKRTGTDPLVQISDTSISGIAVLDIPLVRLTEHQQALARIQEQETEIDQLRKGKPSNMEPGGDSRVKQHLRCPSCWGRDRGRAQRRKWVRQVNGPIQKRCYVCDKCGTEWVVEVRSETEDGILHQTTRTTEVRERTDGSPKTVSD